MEHWQAVSVISEILNYIIYSQVYLTEEEEEEVEGNENENNDKMIEVMMRERIMTMMIITMFIKILEWVICDDS